MQAFKCKEAIVYGSNNGYASEELREFFIFLIVKKLYFGSKKRADLKEITYPNWDPESTVVNFAYTDYGGTFMDKICIQYFKKEYPKNIISETTGWNGYNAFLFGDVAIKFWNEYEDNVLGFENIEEYYSKEEQKETYKAFKWFLTDIRRDYIFNYRKVLEFLMYERSGYYSMQTTGLDYSTSDLIEFLTENEKIISRKELAENSKVRRIKKLDLPLLMIDLEYDSSKLLLEKRLKGEICRKPKQDSLKSL